MRWRGGLSLLVLVLALLGEAAWTGIWMVRQNERGVVFRFGRVVRVCGAGMQFTLPWPAERMERVVTTEVRTMPVGFKLLDRVREIRPEDEEVQWLTGDINIVELQTVLQYMIKDPAAYLTRPAPLAAGRAREFVLQRLAETVLTALLARMSVDDVLSSGKAGLQEEARRQIQALVDELGLGLQVTSVNITKVNPPIAVISAFNDVSSARADRQRVVSEAEGYSMDLLPRSRSEANRSVQEAEIYRTETVSAARGRADRFSKLIAEVRAAPEVSRRRLWLDSVQKALTTARLIVIPKPTPGGPPFVLHHVEP